MGEQGPITALEISTHWSRQHMGKVKADRVSGLKPKKKCCRSKRRCMKCPVVIMRMKKLDDQGLKRKELEKALKKARAA